MSQPPAMPGRVAAISLVREHWLTIDPRSAGLFRMLLGIVLLLHLIDRWRLADDLFSTRGALPASLLISSREIPYFPTVLVVLEQFPMGITAFFVIACCVYASLAAGLLTRTSALASLVIFSSLAHRNPYVLIAADYVLGSMLLWVQLLPISDRFSVDGLIARRRMQSGFISSARQLQRPSLAVFGTYLQLGLIYFATAWQKCGPTWWQDGTALSHVLGFQRFLFPAAALLKHCPEEWLATVTRGVLVFEYLVLPLILLPVCQPWCRRLALVGLAVLHLGIAAILDAGLFSLTMLACLPLLLSRRDWDRDAALIECSGGASPAVPACAEDCRRPRSLPGLLHQAASIWLILGLIGTNFNTNFALPGGKISLGLLDLPQRFAAAHQRWDMFAPDAPRCDSQLIARLRLFDGRTVELQLDDGSTLAGRDLMPRLSTFTWRSFCWHAALITDPQRQAEAESLRAALCEFFVRELAESGLALQEVRHVELWARYVPTRAEIEISQTPEPVWISTLDRSIR
jgi:hypothetical protein